MSEEFDMARPVAVREEPARRVARWRHLKFDVVEPVKALARTVLKRPQVQEIVLRSTLVEAGIVAVLLVKDEAPRLPFLVRYYRGIGVEHFIVLDNGSSDDVRELLGNELDVSLFAAEGDYSRSRFGNDWLNGILSRHCVGKWVLWVDADELLVFSCRPGASLQELVAELDKREQVSLQALMLDMYSAGPANDNVVGPGVDPVSVCSLYDRSGYVRRLSPETGTTWIKGGVRGRLFFPDVWAGPALNKTPLVKWQHHYAFLKGAHELWPRRLNGNGRVEAVLLHFKFTATSVQKMCDETVRKQHTSEYEAYSDMQQLSFMNSVTACFENERDLVENGLFEPIV